MLKQRGNLVYLSLAAAMLIGCGSSTSSTPVTKAFKAAEGGTIATEDGKTSLAIPGGALPSDTTITLKMEAASGDAQSDVYEFGPSGLKFSKPATLSIKFDGTVPEGKSAVLAWLDGTKWTEIAGSSLAGGAVSGGIDHFSKFSIIFKDGQTVAVSECGDVGKNFAACGGDLKGTWTIENICFDEAVLGGNPFKDCPGAVVTAEVNWDGTLTFDGTKMTQEIKRTITDTSFLLPKSCISKTGAPFDCVALNESLDGATCTEAGDDKCSCTGKKEETNTDGVKTKNYSIDGNNLVITESDGTSEQVPYCVDGDKVTANFKEVKEGKTTNFYIVLKRKN